jgi:hypothetical protein
MKTLIISIIIAIVSSVSGFSQQLYTINYTMSFPTGETSDFIGESSFRGMSFDGRAFINDNISLGGHINWSTFYEKIPETTYVDDTKAATGTQFRYLNAVPILFVAHYYTDEDAYYSRFYAGLGVGTYSIENRTDMGVWTVEDNTWHFGFAPEVGILVPIGYDAYVNVSLKWNYAIKTSDTDNNGWFGLNVGLGWNN